MEWDGMRWRDEEGLQRELKEYLGHVNLSDRVLLAFGLNDPWPVGGVSYEPDKEGASRFATVGWLG